MRWLDGITNLMGMSLMFLSHASLLLSFFRTIETVDGLTAVAQDMCFSERMVLKSGFFPLSFWPVCHELIPLVHYPLPYALSHWMQLRNQKLVLPLTFHLRLYPNSQLSSWTTTYEVIFVPQFKIIDTQWKRCQPTGGLDFLCSGCKRASMSRLRSRRPFSWVLLAS